jgi:S13-like H2TH domain
VEPHRIHDQRMQRAEAKDRLKRGSTSLGQVLQEAQTDDVIRGMRVLDLLQSLPGIGEAEARQIMNRLGIADSGLVGELNAAQRIALESELDRPTGVVGSTPDRDYEGYDDDEDDEDEGVAPEAMPHDGGDYGIEDWDRR